MSGCSYSEEEIEQGLGACVLTSGNTRRASDLLARAGKRQVPHTTLWEWCNVRHADRYRQLQEELQAEFNARMAEAHEALVQAYSQLQSEAIEKAQEKLPDATLHEAVALMKAAAVGAGINTEKALLRRGQPTEIRKTIDVADALKRLKAIAPGLIDVNPILIGEAKEVRELREPSSDDSEEE